MPRSRGFSVKPNKISNFINEFIRFTFLYTINNINHDIHSTDIAMYSIEPLIKDFVKNMKKCKITVTYEIDNKDKVIDTEFNTGERPKFYLHLDYKFMKPSKAK